MDRPGLTPDEVAAAIGTRPGSIRHQFVESLAEVAVSARIGPFDAEETEALLQRLGLADADAADVLATLPDPESSPAWWWCLEREATLLIEAMGDPDAPRGLSVPYEGPKYSLEQRCHFIHVALAVVPHTLAYWRRIGVPEDVAWASVNDIGRHVGIHRRIYALTGIEAAWWVTLCLRGELSELGRLQYNRFTLGPGGGDHLPLWYPPDDVVTLGEGFGAGDACLGIHIPDGGPMGPEVVEDSLERAGGFFPEFFPHDTRRVATCFSWLLDTQLAEYLPADSNIIGFQRRFALVPGELPGDEDVMQFVFRKPVGTDLDSLPQRTRMERVAVEHLRGGRHFACRTGWLDLPRGR